MYVPAQNIYATKHRMRLLLADCPRVQTLLGAVDELEAVEKVHTYGEEVTEQNVPVLAYPSGIVCEAEVHARTGPMGEMMGIDQRTLEFWLAFYVPENSDIESISDEEAWVDEQFAAIVYECLERTGKGESIAGESHVQVMNPVYHGAEREPNDERGDDRLDSQPTRPRWFGLIQWEVH